jgi:hypothetical protein
MTQVQVTRKELSNGLQAILINDGMTISEIVRVLGIPRKTVEDHVKSNGFSAGRVSAEQLQLLKNQRVLPLKARKLSIIPRDAVESLVRFIATPETDAIYKQLWDVSRSVHTGDLRQASLDVGLSEDDTLDNLEKALKLARQYKAERDAAVTLIKTQKAFAANHAAIHGLRSVDVLTKYPEGSTALIEETKPKIKNVEAFGPTGILTTGLKRHGLKAKVWTANKSGTKVALFNAEEVETFMSKYKETGK